MKSAPQLSSLVRSALFVADLERATRFYNALGLTGVYYEGTLDAGSVAAALHVADSTLCRCRILKPEGTPNFGMVGLFELTEPALPALPVRTGPPQLGEVAIVFYCSELERLIEAARGNGATWTPDPSYFTMPHRSQREVCIRDPDGILLNVIERDPSEIFETRPALSTPR